MMTKLLKPISIAIIFSLSILSSAQQCFAGDSDNYNLNLQIFPTTFNYLKKSFVSPLCFTSSDWSKVGLIFLGTGICYTQDTSIRNFFQSNRTPSNDSAARFFMNFGDGVFTVPIAAGL